jgi:hypothetical protein
MYHVHTGRTRTVEEPLQGGDEIGVVGGQAWEYRRVA